MGETNHTAVTLMLLSVVSHQISWGHVANNFNRGVVNFTSIKLYRMIDLTSHRVHPLLGGTPVPDHFLLEIFDPLRGGDVSLKSVKFAK